MPHLSTVQDHQVGSQSFFTVHSKALCCFHQLLSKPPWGCCQGLSASYPNNFDSKELLSAARTGWSHLHSAALYDEHYQTAHCQMMSVLQKYLSLATTRTNQPEFASMASISNSTWYIYHTWHIGWRELPPQIMTNHWMSGTYKLIVQLQLGFVHICTNFVALWFLGTSINKIQEATWKFRVMPGPSK